MSAIRNNHLLFMDDLLEREAELLHKMTRDLAIDVYEKDETVVLTMHIPGIDPDVLDITIEDDILKIAGSREKEKNILDQHYLHREIRRGMFERIIPLSFNVDPEKTRAECADGILTIMLYPKRKKLTPAKVAVTTHKAQKKKS